MSEILYFLINSTIFQEYFLIAGLSKTPNPVKIFLIGFFLPWDWFNSLINDGDLTYVCTPKLIAMPKTRIAGIGYYLPEQQVDNFALEKVMDTSDSWIVERTGIRNRHYAKRSEETSTTLGVKASQMALERANLTAEDIDFVIFATLSPDYYFPGCGVLLQRELKMRKVGALDIRNQCSGFIYGLSIADQFIKTGMYKNILLVGAEVQSFGLDFSDKGRNVSVIFGDGAGAVILQSTNKDEQGILSTHLYSDGNFAEILCMKNPGFHFGKYDDCKYKSCDSPFGEGFIPKEVIEQYDFAPFMDGQTVFKHAVERFPEVIREALTQNGYSTQDLDLVIPHQANIRISQFIQRRLGLRDDQVFNNIHKCGNTTAASIPIALNEAWENGRINEGDLICLAAFGSGFTWGSALIRW